MARTAPERNKRIKHNKPGSLANIQAKGLARERSPFFSGETTLGSLTADDRGALARTER